MIDSISRQYLRLLFLKKKDFSSNLKSFSLKAALFILTASAVFTSGLVVRAEIIIGIVESYDLQSKQATINLGKKDSVGKYDRGKIELTSLDSPNVRFIGANIVVISVDENSAVVSVREAPGVQVPVKVGAKVTLDTDSGLARREEEAKLLASEQAEQARQQRQLEQARAEQARQQRQLEQARAEQARQQRQLEQARAEEARQQRQLEQARAEEARQQRQLEQARAEEARQQQQLETARAEPARQQPQLEPKNAPTQLESEDIDEPARAKPARQQQQLETARAEPARQQPQLEPKNAPTQLESEDIDLDEIGEFWRTSSSEDLQGSSIANLPSDYLKTYIAARRDPSPETYYNFAQVLIDYEIPDKALAWLKETQLRFPLTKAVNNFYQAVALIENGKIEQGQNLINTAGLPNNEFKDEFKSYLYTQNGQWDKVFSLSKKRQSPITYNNYLIAFYCTKPPAINRDTRLNLNNCPFGNALYSQPESYEELETFRSISQEALAKYPDNPYILNTLGFLALQSEDYNRAYDYYQQLAQLLDEFDSTPPQLQLLKANAINYLNNFNQNYEFLDSTSQELALLRSRQDSQTKLSVLNGVGNIYTRLSSGVSPVGILGILGGTLLRIRQSKIQTRSIIDERNSVLDQMRTTFSRDIVLMPARPKLEAKSLLELASNQIDNQLNIYDNFWNCQCPNPQSSINKSQNSRFDQDNRCYRTCKE
ncbi:MAG: MAP7 domain-containing protein [Xenococcus sp. MO_188.B8]|nr:MAP7 domain-containing protein [Xenococcus sp. MO_188.B8]